MQLPRSPATALRHEYTLQYRPGGNKLMGVEPRAGQMVKAEQHTGEVREPGDRQKKCFVLLYPAECRVPLYTIPTRLLRYFVCPSPLLLGSLSISQDTLCLGAWK